MRKLKPAQRVELAQLYTNHGWRIMHLVRKYKVHHSTIQLHVAKLRRNVQPIDYCPQEIAEVSAKYSSWKRNRPRDFGSYEEYLEAEEQKKLRKQATCEHKRLVVICLDCKDHLEETKTHKAKVKVTFV